MPNKTDTKPEKEEEKEKNPRISVKIQDDFDFKVVSKMAKNRDTSLSGVIRDIIHQWILSNTEMLESTYRVNIDEINEEIFLETASLDYDKELKPLEVELIDDKTNEVFTVVELEDEIVEKIQKLGMTIQEAILKALDDLVELEKKDPEKLRKIFKKSDVPVVGRVS